MFIIITVVEHSINTVIHHYHYKKDCWGDFWDDCLDYHYMDDYHCNDCSYSCDHEFMIMILIDLLDDDHNLPPRAQFAGTARAVSSTEGSDT